MSETTNTTKSSKKFFNKKNIILLACGVVAIVLVVVLCLTFIGGSLSSVLVNISYDGAMDNVVTHTEVSGKTLVSTMSEGELGIFSEYIEVSGSYKYSVYDFVNASTVLSSTEDIIAVVDSTFGIVLVVSVTSGTEGDQYTAKLTQFVHNGSSVTTNQIVAFDYTEGYSYQDGFFYIDGVAQYYVSQVDGTVIEIDQSYLGIMLDQDYSYYNDDVYVVYDSSAKALYTYNRDDLKLDKSIDLNSYYTNMNSVSIYMLSNGNMYMQVITQLDSYATKYDYMTSSQSKYNLQGYIINLSSGNITSKNVDYIVTDVVSTFDSGAEEIIKDNVNMVYLSYIVDQQYQSRLEIVYTTGNMNISYELDDTYLDLESMIRFNGYYLGYSSSTLMLFGSNGNLIAYDIELLNDTMFVKNDNIYTFDGTLVKEYNAEHTVVTGIDSGVIWWTQEDTGDIVYYLGSTEIARDSEVMVIGDGYMVVEYDSNDGQFTYTYYNGDSVKQFAKSSDYNSSVAYSVLSSSEDMILITIDGDYYTITR